MITKKKFIYERPECEVFEVRAKECILYVSNGVNWNNDTQGAPGGNDTLSDGDSY